MNNDDFLMPVAARIGKLIVEFCGEHEGQEFHADELRQHVADHVSKVAPGSADRVLRDLRQKGVVDYVVVNRAQSRYRIVPAHHQQN